MPNSRHREAMLSPSLRRITKRIRSSITEHFLHGMFYILPPERQNVLPMSPERSVTYVSERANFAISASNASSFLGVSEFESGIFSNGSRSNIRNSPLFHVVLSTTNSRNSRCCALDCHLKA